MNKIKKLAAIATAVAIMGTTVSAADYTVKANTKTYVQTGAKQKTNRDNYARFSRVESNATVLKNSNLNMYTKCTTDASKISECVMVSYPGASNKAYYNSYDSTYQNKYYRTYVKLDATSAYSELYVSVNTTP